MFYFPILVWMGFIFLLSSIPSLKTGASIPVELIFRKFAHLTEYAILVWLFARIFYQLCHLSLRMTFIFSLLGVFLFSLSDEFHQFFVVGRSGNFFDVGFDLLGAVIGLIILWKYVVLNNKK